MLMYHPWPSLFLSEDKAELLGSRLIEKNSFNEDVGIFYRDREKDLPKFFLTKTLLFIVTT